jgi:hypothetical protein
MSEASRDPRHVPEFRAARGVVAFRWLLQAHCESRRR